LVYQENTRYFEDGCVVLFLRTVGSNIWQYRLRIPGITNRYLRRSSRTSNFEKAKQIAVREWQRLCFKQEEGLAVFTKTFSDVAKVVAKIEEERVERGIVSEGHWSYRRTVVFKYLLPFFGSMQINAVSQSKMDDYWPWRLDYWKRPENINPSQTGRKSDQPAFKTIVHDVQMLTKIFSYAENRNWCDKRHIPKIEHPLKPDNLARAYFTEKEWLRVYAYMRHWAKEPATQWQKLTRDRLRYRTALSYHTGMRTVESSNLCWKDIDEFTDLDGSRYARLWVHGKKKSRGIIAPIKVLKLLNAWKQKTKFSEDDDHVFAVTSGKRPVHDDILFRKILKTLNLVTDRNNRPRTLGSLRHTYAMNQLVKLRTDIALLAKNMGTSVEIIENYYAKHFDPSMRANELVRQEPKASLGDKIDNLISGNERRIVEDRERKIREQAFQNWLRDHDGVPPISDEEKEEFESSVQLWLGDDEPLTKI
jgi:integrase